MIYKNRTLPHNKHTQSPLQDQWFNVVRKIVPDYSDNQLMNQINTFWGEIQGFFKLKWATHLVTTVLMFRLFKRRQGSSSRRYNCVSM
jgi:hypothetical protein